MGVTSLFSTVIGKVLAVVIAVLVVALIALGIGYSYRGGEIERQQKEIKAAALENAVNAANYNAVAGAIDRQNDVIEQLRVDTTRRISQYGFASGRIDSEYAGKKERDMGINEDECDGMKRIIGEEWGGVK